mmetsp:Transcript_59146/g.183373  ORF Transcript_59146/g.183373 Transcript_59146/m.183373 type:complete len:224 (+) Transcript_59146:486-1157(+)
MPGPRWKVFRTCLRTFFSPGGHKWQKLHATPFEQPPLKTKAQGLQMPRRCHLEPSDGSSGEPSSSCGSALSSRSTGTPAGLGANLPVGRSKQLAAGLLPAVPKSPVGEGARLVSAVLPPSLSVLEPPPSLSSKAVRPGGGRRHRLAASPTCPAGLVAKGCGGCGRASLCWSPCGRCCTPLLEARQPEMVRVVFAGLPPGMHGPAATPSVPAVCASRGRVLADV